MSGLSDDEKTLLFDGLKMITEINLRLTTIETILKTKKNNIKFKITASIAFVAVAWSILQPFIIS